MKKKSLDIRKKEYEWARCLASHRMFDMKCITDECEFYKPHCSKFGM